MALSQRGFTSQPVVITLVYNQCAYILYFTRPWPRVEPGRGSVQRERGTKRRRRRLVMKGSATSVCDLRRKMRKVKRLEVETMDADIGKREVDNV